MSLQQTSNPNPKLFIIAKLLPPKLGKPNSGKTNEEFKNNLFSFANNLQSTNGSENFADIINDMRAEANKVKIGSGNTPISKKTIEQEVTNIYDRYVNKYDSLIASGEWTSDPNKIIPNYSEIVADADVLLKSYNEYIINRINNNLSIPENSIPSRIISILPDGYLNILAAYNAWVILKQQNTQLTPMNFDVNKLLITSLPQPKPVKEKVVPSGFTEIAVNTFFKKLESTIKNNYSDLMGEYIVPGSDKPCKLFMDKNYNYVVVQGDKRQVYKDPIEARKFCLLGGFDADKVQAFRQSKMITNKLDKPFRVIPITSV